MPFSCFEAFLGKFIENFFFVKKVTISKKEPCNTQKVCFSYHFWNRANPEENLDLFKQLFLIKPVKWLNINKNFFFPKVSHPHTDKLDFVWFRSIFLEIHRELLFLDIKVTISETSTEILRKFVFLYLIWNGQILRKIWICLNKYF